MDLTILGATLKYYRVRRGLQAKEVARLAGIDPANYCRIELGLSNCTLCTLFKILDALGLVYNFYPSTSAVGTCGNEQGEDK